MVVLSMAAWVSMAAGACLQEAPVGDGGRTASVAAPVAAPADVIAAEFGKLSADPAATAAQSSISAIVAAAALDSRAAVGLTQTIARTKPTGSTEALLCALTERVDQRDVQGWACYTLAKLRLAFADDVRYLTDESVAATARAEYAKQRGAALCQLNVERGSDALRAEGLAALRRVVDDFYFAQHRRAGYLGAIADAELYELEHLGVGMVAPEIEGVDEDGVPFKLSDYRGKVVAIDFWGYWCPICVANIPPERELVAKVGDDAFALVGINSDPKDRLAIGMKHMPLPWRSFWDGGDPYGPIARRWNVQEWPMYYVLDEVGVIRAKGEDFDAIAAKVEELVAAHRAREAR
ncbi:MAG: TlpA family protein disulfide reductase [Planctomycetes bacterium]|nr:TlpA family protein disulfide reductase [Planctomycetota bacterium]